MSSNIRPVAPQPDPAVENVGAQADKVLQGLALLYNACHRKNPDSPICGAVQDLMSAVAEVQRYVEQVGDDLEEGTPDDNPDMPPPDAEPMMARDPGPMGGSPMADAGRGFDAALMAAKQEQPPL